MEKSLIAKFVKQKQRGIYSVIVEEYAQAIHGCSSTIALRLIEEDLSQVVGEAVQLNYFSLNAAIAKRKENSAIDRKSKRFEFKDEHELKADATKSPGRFKLD